MPHWTVFRTIIVNYFSTDLSLHSELQLLKRFAREEPPVSVAQAKSISRGPGRMGETSSFKEPQSQIPNHLSGQYASQDVNTILRRRRRRKKRQKQSIGNQLTFTPKQICFKTIYCLYWNFAFIRILGSIFLCIC